MALIDCPECGKQVSDKAEACNGCGFPVAQQAEAAAKEVVRAAQQKKAADHPEYGSTGDKMGAAFGGLIIGMAIGGWLWGFGGAWILGSILAGLAYRP